MLYSNSDLNSFNEYKCNPDIYEFRQYYTESNLVIESLYDDLENCIVMEDGAAVAAGATENKDGFVSKALDILKQIPQILATAWNKFKETVKRVITTFASKVRNFYENHNIADAIVNKITGGRISFNDLENIKENKGWKGLPRYCFLIKQIPPERCIGYIVSEYAKSFLKVNELINTIKNSNDIEEIKSADFKLKAALTAATAAGFIVGNKDNKNSGTNTLIANEVTLIIKNLVNKYGEDVVNKYGFAKMNHNYLENPAFYQGSFTGEDNLHYYPDENGFNETVELALHGEQIIKKSGDKIYDVAREVKSKTLDPAMEEIKKVKIDDIKSKEEKKIAIIKEKAVMQVVQANLMVMAVAIQESTQTLTPLYLMAVVTTFNAAHAVNSLNKSHAANASNNG